MNKAIRGYLIIIVSALILTWPLFLNKLGPIIDLKTHYQWAFQFDKALHDGFLLPRWNALAHMGYGDATFLHIHPLFYYLVSLVNLFAHDLWVSMRVVVFIANMLLGLILWRVARKINDANSLLIVLSVQWAPIFFLQIYFIQSLPSVFAIPFLILAMDGVVTAENSALSFAKVIFGTAFAIISHILVGCIFILCLATTGAVIVFLGKYLMDWESLKYYRNRVVRVALACLFGGALSSFYLVPAIFGRSYINQRGWVFDSANLGWQSHFIFSDIKLNIASLSVQWLIGLPALFAVLISLVVFRDKAIRIDDSKVASFFILIILNVSAIFFASKMSWLIWANSESLRQIQFPWRFTSVMSVASSFLLLKIPEIAVVKCRLRSFILIFLLLNFAITLSFAYFACRSEGFHPPDSSWLDGNLGQVEYLPATVPAEALEVIQELQTLSCVNSRRCILEAKNSHSYQFHFDKGIQSEELFPVFDHPGWGVLLNHSAVTHSFDPKSGLIRVFVPSGVSTVRIVWKGSFLEDLGLGISISCALILLLVFIERDKLFAGKFKSYSRA